MCCTRGHEILNRCAFCRSPGKEAGALAGGVPGAMPGLVPGLLAGGAAVSSAKVDAKVEEAIVYDWEKTEFYEKDKQIVPEDQRSLKPDATFFQRSVGTRPKNPRDRFIHPQVWHTYT